LSETFLSRIDTDRPLREQGVEGGFLFFYFVDFLSDLNFTDSEYDSFIRDCIFAYCHFRGDKRLAYIKRVYPTLKLGVARLGKFFVLLSAIERLTSVFDAMNLLRQEGLLETEDDLRLFIQYFAPFVKFSFPLARAFFRYLHGV